MPVVVARNSMKEKRMLVRCVFKVLYSICLPFVFTIRLASFYSQLRGLLPPIIVKQQTIDLSATHYTPLVSILVQPLKAIFPSTTPRTFRNFPNFSRKVQSQDNLLETVGSFNVLSLSAGHFF